jgi:hypothetical protein
VFRITNVGGGILTGDVAEICDDFSIIGGAGPFSLGAGEFVDVNVRFEPTSLGIKSCLVTTGTECADVPCKGTGVEGGIEVYFDIKPGSCPNPLNVKSKGVLPVAILGTENFDVMDIDLMMLRLTYENSPGEVMPLRWSYEDVGTPFMGDPCECHEMGGDGLTDLTLKFETQEVVTELGLATMPDGEIPLTIMGMLVNGEPMSGVDCIRLKGVEELDGLGDDDIDFGVSEVTEDGAAPEIEINFALDRAEYIRLEIFDVRGRTIRTLIDGVVDAGGHTLTWDKTGESGGKVQSGVYFARLRRESGSATRKIMVVN